jgi:hypothetical protein
MKTYKKILIGGLGALTPIIMNLLAVDLEVLFLNLTLFAVLGYLIRVIILFYLGGITAFLHKDETSPVKIFELGIVAPALITALINAGQIDIPKANLQETTEKTSLIQFVSAVYAQTPQEKDTTKIEIKPLTMPKETRIQQFWRGLFGLSPKNIYFVFVGIYDKKEEAQKRIDQVKEKTKDFKFQIFFPYGADKKYAVSIGSNLTQTEALQRQKKAIESGYFKEVIIWNLIE